MYSLRTEILVIKLMPSLSFSKKTDAIPMCSSLFLSFFDDLDVLSLSCLPV